MTALSRLDRPSTGSGHVKRIWGNAFRMPKCQKTSHKHCHAHTRPAPFCKRPPLPYPAHGIATYNVFELHSSFWGQGTEPRRTAQNIIFSLLPLLLSLLPSFFSPYFICFFFFFGFSVVVCRFAGFSAVRPLPALTHPFPLPLPLSVSASLFSSLRVVCAFGGFYEKLPCFLRTHSQLPSPATLPPPPFLPRLP